jgi:hypothetical protein
MANTSRRKYPVGKFPIYDFIFDRELSMSVISGGNSNFNTGWIEDALRSKSGVEGLLMKWKGDLNKQYVQSGQLLPSKLLEAEQALQAVDDTFESMKQTAVNTGRPLPKVMPVDLLERKLKAEAKFDVVIDEIKKLEKKLSEFQEKETTTKSKDILRNGPQGSGRLMGGILVEVDGQRVSKSEDGELYIAEPSSPYNGMLTSDYFQFIVHVWQKTKSSYKGAVRNFEKQRRAGQESGEKFTKEFPKKPAFPSIPKECKLVSLN